MTDMMNGKIEPAISSNAEGLAVAKGLAIIAEHSVGDYQGRTFVLLKDDFYRFGIRELDTVHIYVIDYGSCGGCDWYENFYGTKPTYKDCITQYQDEKPVLILPLEDFQVMKPKRLYDLFLKEDGYQSTCDEYGWTIGSAKKLILATQQEIKGDKK